MINMTERETVLSTLNRLIQATIQYVKENPGCIVDQFIPWNDRNSHSEEIRNLEALEAYIADATLWENAEAFEPGECDGAYEKDGNELMWMIHVKNWEYLRDTFGMYDGIRATINTDLNHNILEISLEQD